MFYSSVFIIERIRAFSGKKLVDDAVALESQEGI
jgi:hypothetical protein